MYAYPGRVVARVAAVEVDGGTGMGSPRCWGLVRDGEEGLENG